jgi:predicted transposase/invertase (TIGR01784 family)
MTNYIRFDWAMKRLLRDKANYAVLEGLLTTLLNEKITIKNLLESESNQEDPYDKLNRVDILAEDSKGDLILFEIQNNNEYAYFQRMLFGVSKLVTEYINRGQGYDNIRKIYSVNIVYFALGSGKDYVYHGTTEFRGIHQDDILQLSPFQREKFKVETVSALYPEYYILRVNDFDKWSSTPLDQWIYFLNTGNIPDEADAPGMSEAREKLKVDALSKVDREAYYRHLDNVVILRNNIVTEREEGRFEGIEEGLREGMKKGREMGREEGMKKGREEGIEEGLIKGREEGIEEGMKKGREEGIEEGLKKGVIQIARNLKACNVDIETIKATTGLSSEEIERL